MPVSSLGRRRPRPVADAPALDGHAVAKRWLVELVALAPLDRAAGLPGPRFAEDAPRLCTAIGAALAHDGALDDLLPGGDLAPLASGAAALAGAGPVEGLEALRSVTWAELLEHRPTAVQLGELADRLAAVIAILATSSLEAASTEDLRPGDRGPLAAVLRRHDEPPASRAAEAPGAEPAGAPVPNEPRQEGLGPEGVRSDPLRPPEDLATSPDVARIEDASAHGTAPWSQAIERRLARHHQDGRPFTVLCFEVLDAERLLAADRDGAAQRALEAAESAALAELRPADALIRERVGRYWLTAPDTDGDEARALAHRIAANVERATQLHGTSLHASVGLATCPSDGVDAAALEGRAEEGLFAAQAAGLRVAAPVR